ncbi:MAG TPA: dihydroorotate dehydrogenase, partial [Planctomycetota bacterium]|nr:dihydroorotate dehydrogenase [Planctomycetota bacterium]
PSAIMAARMTAKTSSPSPASNAPAARTLAPESVDLSVQVGPLALKNPLMTASGTAGLGLEMEPFWDLSVAGAVVVKTLTMKPRRGNPMPRLCETPSGLLNSIGLPNKGLPHFLKEVLPRLAGKADCLVVNIAGTCTGEFGEMAARLDGAEGVDALELNISCPNVEGGDLPFGRDPQVVYRLVGDVRAATRLPIITKLTPNVSDVVAIARAAHEAGSDAVSVINTLLGMAVDWRSGRPGLGTVIGGLSGPAIKPVALRMVWDVARSVDIPVVGIGGIMSADDALEFLCAGASAVQVGTAHYRRPDAIPRMLEAMRASLAAAGRAEVRSVIKTLRVP